MRQINNNPYVLGCGDGENISVSIEPVNTSHLVSYSLDGLSRILPPGTDITFAANVKADGSPIILNVLFDFSNPAGSYNVEVRGDRGGDVSKVTVQSPGNPVSQLAFTFLPGDPTIPPP